MRIAIMAAIMAALIGCGQESPVTHAFSSTLSVDSTARDSVGRPPVADTGEGG